MHSAAQYCFELDAVDIVMSDMALSYNKLGDCNHIQGLDYVRNPRAEQHSSMGAVDNGLCYELSIFPLKVILFLLKSLANQTIGDR